MKLTIILFICVINTQYALCAVTLECAFGYQDCEECAVDGVWTMWSVWGSCEGECGGVGRELRTRNCSNPSPIRNGALCAGDQRQVKPCRTSACTVEKYEQLLAQDRVRRQQLQALRDAAASQSALVAQCLSAHCSLTDISSVLTDQTTATKFWNALQCVKVNTGCPVAGGWGPWSQWTRCSAQCGSGRRVRCHACCDPPSSSPHLSCPGDPCEFQDCNGTNCVRGGKHEGDWSEWSEWSDCNAPCNLGISRRSRICQPTKQNSKRKISSYDSDLDVNDNIYEDDYYDYDLYAGEPKRSIYDYNSAEAAEENEPWKILNSKPKKNYQINNENYSEDLNENIHNGANEGLLTTFNLVIRFSDADTQTDENVDSTLPQVTSEDDVSSKEITTLINNKKSYSTMTTSRKNANSETGRIVTSTSENPVLEKSTIDDTRAEEQCIEEDYVDNTSTEPPEECNTLIPHLDNKEYSVEITTKCTPTTRKCSTIMPGTKKCTKHKGTTQEYNCFFTQTKECKWVVPKTTTEEVECNTVKPHSKTDQNLINIKKTTLADKYLKSTKQSPKSTTKTATKYMTPNKGVTNRVLQMSTIKTKHSTQKTNENLEEISTIEPLLSRDIDVIKGQSNVTNENYNGGNCDLKAVFQLPSQNASFESTDCDGTFEELKFCNVQSCNADGGWSRWSAWSACSANCGLGYQVSTRSCTNPEPPSEGTPCVGDSTWKRSCFLQPCAVKALTSSVTLMSGDSRVRYTALHQPWALLMLYMRLRPFSSSGALVTRHSLDGDTVQLSLYDGYVLVHVKEGGCHADMISNQQISVGDWHEVLLTIVSASVTLRLDDSVLPQVVQLSCRPSSPSYDSPMTIGGQFMGEVDRLAVNLHKFALQKKHTKRDVASVSEEVIEPEDSHQVQYEVSTEETTTVSLAMLLQAPCFLNESAWKVELAIQPQFTDGLVLFLRGRGRNEWLAVTLDHSHVRLRLRLASGLAGCEEPLDIAPHTWIHLVVNKPDRGPVGLAVNGGPRCVASFDDAANTTVDLAVKCTDSVFMGEMPTWVKSLLLHDGTQSPPINSPLGLLGSLSVDNHTLDLSRLPRRVPPDLTRDHPSSSYWYSSLTASTSAFYEEILVQVGEPFSLTCMYDLSNGKKLSQENMYKRDRDTAEYSASWMKVDLPVELAFDKNGSNVQYQIWDNGKTVSLNVSSFLSPDIVEGFYSCWLHYPLPLQPGLNIITYGVIVVSTDQDGRVFLGSLVFHNLIVIIVLLVLLILWLIAEIVLDFHKKSGFYRCGLLTDEDARVRVHNMIYSQKGEEMLGGTEAADRSYKRYLEYVEQKEKEEEDTIGETTDDEMALVKKSKAENKPKVTPVLLFQEDAPARKSTAYYTPNSSFVNNDTSTKTSLKPLTGNAGLRAGADSPSHYGWTKRNIIDISSEECILALDAQVPNTPQVEKNRAIKPVVQDNVVISENWRKYELNKGQTDTQSNIGVIQKTSAYRNIKNELKFIPEKFLELEKNQFYISKK